MTIIGLTGGYASGKTTVAQMFKEKGAKATSADEIVHALLKGQGACARRVKHVFGKTILTQGSIDRRKLGKIVFSDPVSRKTLERLIHPEVIREIKSQVQEYRKKGKGKIFIIEVPLLFEAGLERLFDYTITVNATRPQQICRSLQTRSITSQEIKNRIQAQLPFAIKRRMADILIDNRGSLSYTKRQVTAIWQRLNRKHE